MLRKNVRYIIKLFVCKFLVKIYKCGVVRVKLYTFAEQIDYRFAPVKFVFGHVKGVNLLNSFSVS